MNSPLLEKRRIHYDKEREFNIVRVHDGEGNLYAFNCPPDISAKVKDVLKRGELISFRLKGQTTKKMDSTADMSFRIYNLLEPLEFKDAHLTRTEFDELLAAAKKRAPLPGRETHHSPFLLTPPAIPPGTPPVEKVRLPSLAVHGKKIGVFQEQDVYHPNPDRPPYVLAKKTCVKCDVEIPGSCRVSRDTEGNFSRLQGFVPFDKKARPVEKGHQNWCCGCNTVDSPPLAEPVSASDVKIIKGYAYHKFERRGTQFYHKGELIRQRETGTHFVNHCQPCMRCQEPIQFEATVAFKKGLPFAVSNQKPIFKGSAVPVKPKSNYWQHVKCPAASVAPEPEIVAAPEPEIVAAPEPEIVKPLPMPAQPGIALYAKLEQMSLDPAVGDREFRGAAWMLCRYLAGKGGC